MGFQIHDSKGEPVGMRTLDQEACDFWNVTIHKKWYATPYPAENENDIKQVSLAMSTNWFDVIGWKIHYEKLTTWKQVIDSLRNLYITECREEIGKGLEGVKYMLNHIQPFVNLIRHWERKGYTPVPIPE